MAITKKEIEEIGEVVEKRIEPYFTAIQGDFNKVYKWQGKVDGWRKDVDGWRKDVDGWRKDVSAKLDSLERRVDHLAEVATRHSKKLRAIRQEIVLMRGSRRADHARIQEIEERVSALELPAGVGLRQV